MEIAWHSTDAIIRTEVRDLMRSGADLLDQLLKEKGVE